MITNAAGLTLDCGEERLIFGEIFPRHGPPHAITAPTNHLPGPSDLHFDALLERYWGNYIAVSRSQESWRILRAPCGALPAYYVTDASWVAVASDPEALLAAGLFTPAISWLEVARTHYTRDLPARETAFTGLNELLPGTELEISASHGHSIQEHWSPWRFVKPVADHDHIERLREVVQNSVSALTSRYHRPLLGLSGGLDSSIVAACLKGHPGGFSALTMINSGGGDERNYARPVAEAAGAKLIERAYRLSDVDLNCSVAQHRPRPCGWIHERAYNKAVVRAASATHADVFVSGNGGDNVFYNSNSARVVLDRIHYSGINPALFRSIAHVAARTGSSVRQVTREAWRVHRTAGRGYRWPRTSRLLHSHLVSTLEDSFSNHSWLEQPRNALPGKSAHIAMLLRMHYHLDALGNAWSLPIACPLATQPVIELCLSIQSWLWCYAGHDRMAARSAFQGRLPAAVIARHTKGSPDAFALELLESRLPAIRERLLDGEMMRHHLLDRPALEDALRPAAVRYGQHRALLMALTDTEAWLGHWSHVGRPDVTA